MMPYSLSLLLQQMSRDSFYPHEVKSPIQVLKTHSAIVLLTGDYAYKIKKPVDLGFLDFSTLAKRKAYLKKELSLNQRVSSEIYLAVIPISQKGDNLILDNQDNVVDYTLKMRQFPQDRLLSQLEKKGKLTPEIIQQLGQVIADFHQNSLTNDYILSFGEVSQIKKAIDENYEQTDQYIGWLQTQQQYDETKAFTDQYLTEKQPYFKQRQADEKIRECHGDLHLNNICYWQDKIYLFDRIEFNESFRFVDGMYDVAFTVMDLEANQQNVLSNLFLNIYLERTGDWQGLQVLPFYLCRQTYVRAKVNSLLLADESLSKEERQKAIDSARRYYHLSWQYTQKKQGKLIIMSGLSGSGKSTVAGQLAPEIKAIHIRSDAVRKHLAGIELNQTGTNDMYRSQMNLKTYQRLLDLGEMLTKEGYTVILDAKFDQRQWRKMALQIAQTFCYPFYIIHCKASLESLSQRLNQRQGDISDATSQLLQQQVNQFEEFTEKETAYLITWNTEQNKNSVNLVRLLSIN